MWFSLLVPLLAGLLLLAMERFETALLDVAPTDRADGAASVPVRFNRLRDVPGP